MLGLQGRLLFFEIVYAITERIGLSDLRQIQQSQQTGQDNQHDGIADRADCLLFRLEGRRILIPARITLPAHCQ